MEPFVCVLNPGTSEEGWPTFVKVTWDGQRLSLSGVEGPKSYGGAHGACGQINIAKTNPGAGWTADMVAELASIWKRWHLNDMRAGCEHQRAEGWDHRPRHREAGGPARPIDPSKPGLLGEPCPVCGYKYGTAWLREDVPEEVLAELRAFPETEVTPAWV